MEIRTLKKGDVFTIQLKGNATAGYEWNYEMDNPKLISLTKEFVQTDVLKEKYAGASADELFTITALEKGTAIIHFFQKRNWEDESIKPVNEKKIQLVIE